MSNSLRPHGLQHARLPCPLPTTRAYSNSCPLMIDMSDTIQPSHPLSFHSPPTFNLSQHQGLFQCQLFSSGGQRAGVLASSSVLPMNSQDWFPWGWTGWIFLQSRGLLRVFSNTIVQNINFLATSCEELTHWKRPWCWEGLGAGGEGDDRVWDGWMASPTRWAWVWMNSGSW